MIDDLIKQHSGEITNLLKDKYGLNAEQASSSSNSITDAIGNVLNNKLGSGNLDFNTIMDLFNTSTDNKSSSMFSQLSETVMHALSNSGLGKDLISKISTDGLDDIISAISKGKFGNIDMDTLTQLIGSFSGKSGGGAGGLLDNLTGLFGKK
ncbi:MAG: hypothetical protein KA954_15340 [Chitinophagales bacterium]|nr:hypothetical protein [Bacteroidota bacterium]MBP7400965.1 hypothetical protein [Chitinophagales bacterium]MBP8754684.1 hypothetical protein [Chitinophagales bacterium]MBP9190811.1 hypothetical protein [Chitinophagales bacterium]MBP9705780.1 hypothetical protein [Chitinophagales bacterium]